MSRPFLGPEDDRAGWRHDVDEALKPERFSTRLPSLPHPAIPNPNGPSPNGWWSIPYTFVTGGFVTSWFARIHGLTRQALFVHASVNAPASSSTQIRLRLLTVPGAVLATSGSYDVTGTFREWTFEWLHGLELWTGQHVFLSYEVNLATYGGAGVGDVAVFVPYGGGFAERVPVRATTTGLLPGG